MIKIRRYKESDWPAVWDIIRPVFRSGETYAYPIDITEGEAPQVWINKPVMTYVGENQNGEILGTYYLKPNQPGRGSHICNCGYIVSVAARGNGIATRMCEHSQGEAIDYGFQAMQFNLVVSTNEGAVRLWQKMGFSVIGTIPKGFNHPHHGLVDAFIMYKELVGKPSTT